MKDSIVKIKLIDGEPRIGKLEVDEKNAIVNMELLIAGILDGDISIEAIDEYITLTISKGSRYVSKSSFKLVSEILDFKNFQYSKKNGILYVYIPIISQDELDNEPVKVTI